MAREAVTSQRTEVAKLRRCRWSMVDPLCLRGRTPDGIEVLDRGKVVLDEQQHDAAGRMPSAAMP
jgi:hypothetical protein